jgi:hypothetical protein
VRRPGKRTSEEESCALTIYFQGASAGAAVRRRDISCNGGGEATAGELQVFCLRPIARSTPDHRHRKAPDGHPDMRLKSAHQSMITDVSRLRLHLCTIIASTASNTDRGGGRHAASAPLDTGHQSKIRASMADVGQNEPLRLREDVTGLPRKADPPADGRRGRIGHRKRHYAHPPSARKSGVTSSESCQRNVVEVSGLLHRGRSPMQYLVGLSVAYAMLTPSGLTGKRATRSVPISGGDDRQHPRCARRRPSHRAADKRDELTTPHSMTSSARTGLLRACRQRPHGRRAAEKRDEVAPSHCCPQGSGQAGEH